MRLRGVVVLCVAFALDAACARVQCQYNSECGARARCAENRCVTDCFADRDCPSETPRCTENGECVAGPCAGQYLTTVESREDAQGIWINL